ncbi:hypothetical protein [Micromonospora sp. IBHARD004]|uniref:hypothetical protein n=1 Tax=Micromonospora sp. IBHARD004 TaxID=3457764 RepID=UPI00405877E0
MSVASKLQIKPGQDVVVLRKPDDVEIEGTSSGVVEDVASADGAVVFVTAAADANSAPTSTGTPSPPSSASEGSNRYVRSPSTAPGPR